MVKAAQRRKNPRAALPGIQTCVSLSHRTSVFLSHSKSLLSRIPRFMLSRRHFLKLSALGSLAPLRLPGAEAPPSLEDTLTGIMDTFVKERGMPGGQLAVARAGKLILSKGFGKADRDKDLAV